MFLKFCFVFLFIATLIGRSRQQHFTIVGESRLFSGKPFHALVTVHDASDEVQLRARLLRSKPINTSLVVEVDQSGPDYVEKVSAINVTGSHLIRLTVPTEWQAAYHTFEVVGTGGVAFNHSRQIFLRGLEQQRYDFVIMLDRDSYVLGDTVRYSILVVDERGKAIQDGESIVIKTLVTDGMHVLITQQLTVTTNRGLYKGEIKLKKDCSNGVLDIVVNYMGQIKSESIVLPQQEIRDDLDMQLKLILHQTNNESKMVASIQANYKFGAPIGGNLTVLLKEVAGWFPFILPGPDDDFCLEDDCVRFQLREQSFHASKDVQVDVPKMSYAIRHYILYVKVTDQLTGRSRWTWKPVEPNFSDKVDIVVSKLYFAPDLPLKFQVVIKRNLGLNISEENQVKLKVRANFLDFTFDIKKGVDTDTREYSLSNVTDRLSVTLSPPEDAAAVILQVEINNHIYARKLLRTMPYNAANASLAIITDDQHVKVGSNLSVDIYASAGLDFITYQITSIRSYSIVHWGSAKVPNRGPLHLSIPVTEDFVSHFYLNVYGVTDTGEFVADNQHFNTIEENPLQIELDVEPLQKVSPGTLVNFTVRTNPNTVVLLRAFDPVQPNPDFGKFENPLLEFFEESEESIWRHWKDRELEEVSLLEQHIKWSNTSHLQSRLFAPPRLSLFTNAILQNVPSSQNQTYRTPPTDASQIEERHKRVSLSRSWLWNSVLVGEHGEVSLSIRAPDRISLWKTSVFGVDESHDIGHATVPSIQVTKPLFLLLDVPATLVRGEAVLLRVLVFQESRQDVNVTISSKDERFQLLNRSNHRVLPSFSESTDLKANDTRFNVSSGDVAEFLISPLFSGALSIEAMVVDDEGNEDIVVRTINIKNQLLNERPFVYEAKEALRYDEDLACHEPSAIMADSASDHRLNISFQVNSMNDQIGNLRVNACVWYYKEEKTNFLLDLDLPSGFEVPKDIRKSTQVTGVHPDNYKVNVVDGRVRWRFENLKTDDVICTSVTSKRVFTVYNLKPAKVTAYTSFDLHNAKRAGVYYKAPSFTIL